MRIDEPSPGDIRSDGGPHSFGKSKNPRCQRVTAGVFRNLEGGAEGSRTLDLCIANAALSQLSYRPDRSVKATHRPGCD